MCFSFFVQVRLLSFHTTSLSTADQDPQLFEFKSQARKANDSIKTRDLCEDQRRHEIRVETKTIDLKTIAQANHKHQNKEKQLLLERLDLSAKAAGSERCPT